MTEERNTPAPGRDGRREARHISIYTLATFVPQLSSFLIVPLFWQKLSLADYGVIGLTEMIGTFLILFLGLSLDTSITRFYYEWPNAERRRRVGTLWVLNWLACLATGAVATVLLRLSSRFLFPDVAFEPYLLFGMVLAVLRAMFAVPYATIRIVNSPALFAAYNLSTFAIQLTLNVVFVLVLDQGLYGYYTSSIIGSAITAAIGGAIMLWYAEPALERSGLRESLRFALPSVPTSMINAATQVLDRFLLQRFGSLEAVGVYAVSLRFTNLILYLHNALKLSYMPFLLKAVAADRTEGIRTLVRARQFYLLPLCIAALGLSIFIGDFVRLAGSAEYFQVANWVPWFTGAVLVSTLSVYFAPGLFLAKRSDLTWIPQLAQLAVVAAAGVLLIPRFQLSGVVASRYASAITFFAVTLALSQRVYPVAVEWRRLLEIAAVLIVAVIAGRAIDVGSVALDISARTVLLAATIVLLGYVVTRSLTTLRARVRSIFAAGPTPANSSP